MDDERLFEARYDITSAARHLRMPRSTMAAWAQGMKPFKRVLDLPKPGYLSFVNLTEAFVLFTMRRHYRIQMPRIREAIEYVERELGVPHPLAFQEFKTDKVDLFVRIASGAAVNVSRRGRHTWTKSLPISNEFNGAASALSRFFRSSCIGQTAKNVARYG